MEILISDLLIFCAPFGPYLDINAGIRCQTSTWRRVEDTSIPARAPAWAPRSSNKSMLNAQ